MVGGALVLSSLATVVVMAPVAALAAVSASRSAGGTGRRPGPDLLAVVAATGLVPLIALAGPLAAAGGLVVFGGGALALSLLRGGGPRRAAASLAPMLAVTAVVVARHQGSTLALALVGATLAYDMGAFVMGNGRGALGGPLGVAFGVVSIAVVAVFVAAVVNPPFSGSRPVVVFAGLAVLAPVGVWLLDRAVAGERLPAARRFDSLALSGPFWVVAAALLLHR